MCRHPLTIVNPSRWIDPSSCQQLYIDVPCGHCSECALMTQNEWLLRLYYEQLRAIRDGQWMLFDTLTYDNDHLPRLSRFYDVPKDLDFACFDKNDIQLFMKRLRYYCPCRFFIVSEYGSDRRYHHRPHYHALFFVDRSVNPIQFSRFVSLAWQNGRTDGVPFKSASYVLGNVFHEFSSRVSSYVLKYVTKSYAYSDLVTSRLDRLKKFDAERALMLRPFVRQFHLQSLNFGYGYIADNFSPIQLSAMSSLPVMTHKGILHVQFPLSFKRKFFYRYERENGRVRWFCTDLLYRFNAMMSQLRINALANCLSTVVPYMQARKAALYSVLKRGRFNTGSAEKVFSQSDSVDGVGFRNYSARDRVLPFKTFHPVDFGNSIDGYNVDTYFTHVPLGTEYHNMTTLDDMSKLVLYDSECESVLNKFTASLVGDPHKDVDLVVDRVKNLFKSMNYAVV